MDFKVLSNQFLYMDEKFYFDNVRDNLPNIQNNNENLIFSCNTCQNLNSANHVCTYLNNVNVTLKVQNFNYSIWNEVVDLIIYLLKSKHNVVGGDTPKTIQSIDEFCERFLNLNSQICFQKLNKSEIIDILKNVMYKIRNFCTVKNVSKSIILNQLFSYNYNVQIPNDYEEIYPMLLLLIERFIQTCNDVFLQVLVFDIYLIALISLPVNNSNSYLSDEAFDNECGLGGVANSAYNDGTDLDFGDLIQKIEQDIQMEKENKDAFISSEPSPIYGLINWKSSTDKVTNITVMKSIFERVKGKEVIKLIHDYGHSFDECNQIPMKYEIFFLSKLKSILLIIIDRNINWQFYQDTRDILNLFTLPEKKIAICSKLPSKSMARSLVKILNSKTGPRIYVQFEKIKSLNEKLAIVMKSSMKSKTIDLMQEDVKISITDREISDYNESINTINSTFFDMYKLFYNVPNSLTCNYLNEKLARLAQLQICTVSPDKLVKDVVDSLFLLNLWVYNHDNSRYPMQNIANIIRFQYILASKGCKINMETILDELNQFSESQFFIVNYSTFTNFILKIMEPIKQLFNKNEESNESTNDTSEDYKDYGVKKMKFNDDEYME